MDIQFDVEGCPWGDTEPPLWEAAVLDGEMEDWGDLISELLRPDDNPPAETIPAAAQQELGSSDALASDSGSAASGEWWNSVDGAGKACLNPDAGHADAEQQLCVAAPGEDCASRGQKRLRSDPVDGASSQDAATEAETSGSADEPAAATTGESGLDEAHANRQLRLIRNREAASQSRSRKKCYVKELEAKCKMLEGHCTQLQQAVNFTAMENLALREELERAKKHKGPVCAGAEPAALESDSLPSESLPRSIYLCLIFLIACLCPVWESQPRLLLNTPNGAPAKLAREQSEGRRDVVSRIPAAWTLKKRRRKARKRRLGSSIRKRRLLHLPMYPPRQALAWHNSDALEAAGMESRHRLSTFLRNSCPRNFRNVILGRPRPFIRRTS